MNRNTLSLGWVVALYGTAFVISAWLVVKGMGEPGGVYLVAGLACCVVSLTTLPIGLYVAGAAAAAGGSSGGGDMDRLRTQVIRMTESIEHLEETMVLSDDARRALNRNKERELLRRAIEEDIKSGEFSAAMVLVRELAERFGYRADAEELREKIEVARTRGEHEQVRDQIASLNALIASHKWEQAGSEASRIARVFPDSPLTDGLHHKVESAKTRYKEDIERRFLQAAQEERIEEAMTLLHEMDHLLSEGEAERFREVARGVIGKARENLGAQFKLAVHDKSWTRATEIGERIINEFPNSRMAVEVRDLIDTIRERSNATR